MNVGILAKRAGKLANENSPAILTAIGVTGALTTAYLTGKASFKAAEILREAEEDQNRKAFNDPDVFPLEPREKFELVWKQFVPAAGMAALTVAAIISANHIGTRRAAAIASAYTLSEKAFEEYKGKVLTKFGEKKEQTVRDEIAQDQVKARALNQSKLVVVNGGDVLCFDQRTGRYFNSSLEALKKAQNDTNHIIINDSYASLTDFYDNVGLPATDESEEVGWNSDKLLELEFSTVLSEDGRPCLAVGFMVKPKPGYSKSY